MHVCMYVCMYLFRYLCIYVCIYVFMYLCIYVFMYLCIYVFMLTEAARQQNVCIYIYIYKLKIYIYIYIYFFWSAPSAVLLVGISRLVMLAAGMICHTFTTGTVSKKKCLGIGMSYTRRSWKVSKEGGLCMLAVL